MLAKKQENKCEFKYESLKWEREGQSVLRTAGNKNRKCGDERINSNKRDARTLRMCLHQHKGLMCAAINVNSMKGMDKNEIPLISITIFQRSLLLV